MQSLELPAALCQEGEFPGGHRHAL